MKIPGKTIKSFMQSQAISTDCSNELTEQIQNNI